MSLQCRRGLRRSPREEREPGLPLAQGVASIDAVSPSTPGREAEALMREVAHGGVRSSGESFLQTLRRSPSRDARSVPLLPRMGKSGIMCAFLHRAPPLRWIRSGREPPAKPKNTFPPY